MIRTILLLLALGLAAIAHGQFIPPPITSNCGMPCTTAQDCAEYDTDITVCLTCMPTNVCGNPSCFDSCATSNSCPPECPICSFQQCVAPEANLECTVEPEPDS